MNALKQARKHVADKIAAEFPKWFVFSGYEKPDALDRVTVGVGVERIKRDPAAPMGAVDLTLTVALISPIQTNNPKAADQLETELPRLLDFIVTEFGTAWDEAELGVWKDSNGGDYVAWTFPLHLIMSWEGN